MKQFKPFLVTTMRSSSEVALKIVLYLTFRLLQLVRGSPEVNSGVSNYSFPDDFMFGVATAATQIEGGWNEGGKGESVWDTVLHEDPSFSPDIYADVAADSYHRYMEDIEMIKSLGVQAYRMSISWPRILPKGTDDYINQDGVKYYRTIFEELLKANITPVVTIFHWDMPTQFINLGGWTNAKIIDYFEDYSRILFNLYGDIVKMWITINEPNEYCKDMYGFNMLAPNLKPDGMGLFLCTHNSLLGHARVYRMYEKEFKPVQQGKVSIVLEAIWADPKDPNEPKDVGIAETYIQLQMGMFAHPIYSKEGDYPELIRELLQNISSQLGLSRSLLPYFTDEEVKALRGSADFFGLNHYTTHLISISETEPNSDLVPPLFPDIGVQIGADPSWSLSGPGWEFKYPPGFRKLLNWLQNSYEILKTIPIIVTENGLCDFGEEGTEDYRRVSYYNDYLYQVLLAIHEDGVNIKGYFAWSLMDDFEWTDGYITKFGLFSVDFDSPNRTRTPKLSAYNYANIVRTRRIDFDYFKRPENQKRMQYD